MQAFFHHGVDDFLCKGIPQSMRNSGSTNAKFASNVLFLPALYVKLDDLHVYRLQGLQGNVVSRGHWPVLLSVALWNLLKLYYFCLFYMAGSTGSVKFEYLFLCFIGLENFPGFTVPAVPADPFSSIRYPFDSLYSLAIWFIILDHYSHFPKHRF